MITPFPTGLFYHANCFDVLRTLPDGCVDMILADLPYGTTRNKWDSVLPLDQLWIEYWRICRGTVALTAAQPFTSSLVMSQIEHFKYDWVWKKPKGTGHLNAKKQPMRDKEDILIFYKERCLYIPQFGQGEPYKNKAGKIKENGLSTNYGDFGTHREGSDGKRYPKQIIEFPVTGRGTLHPTQKPVALFEYLIKTYTHEGMLVLDNTAGLGTTAIAAINTSRRWICIEKDAEYATQACERIRQHGKT